MKLIPQKLEGWGYLTVANLQPFLYDPPAWRTDRRTDDSIQCAKYICNMLSCAKNDFRFWFIDTA